MKKILKSIFNNPSVISVVDFFMFPSVLISSKIIRLTRSPILIKNNKLHDLIKKSGIYPIIDSSCEPIFDKKNINRETYEKERKLPAVDLNLEEQFAILERFNFAGELRNIPEEKKRENQYYYHNKVFEAGDGEALYSMIRTFKPGKILEIGCDISTFLTVQAIKRNKDEDPSYSCHHVCITPDPPSYLETLGVNLCRETNETLDKSVFSALEENDFLLINNSHTIRPQGDVLFQYMEILPILRNGVIIHFHNIFTPRHYPIDLIYGSPPRFWNEQYLLEAFLSFNREYRIILALNYLKHNYMNSISSRFPILSKEKEACPSSFWIMKN